MGEFEFFSCFDPKSPTHPPFQEAEICEIQKYSETLMNMGRLLSLSLFLSFVVY